MPSISVFTSFTLVCDSKRGFGSLMLRTQIKPSRTSSPEIAGSLSFKQIVRFRVLIDGLRQRGAEAGQMRAAVRVRNRVGEAQNLIVVAVVILQHDIDKDFVALPRKHDRLRVNDLLVLAELLYELFDAVLVEERLFLRRIAALVGQRDFETGIQKGEFAQARSRAART